MQSLDYTLLTWIKLFSTQNGNKLERELLAVLNLNIARNLHLHIYKDYDYIIINLGVCMFRTTSILVY